MNNKTLNLIVTTHWFNMIDSGFKQEEYRKIKPYWTTRFLSGEYWGMPPENFKAGQYETKYPFSHVLIRSAYTSIFTIFEFEGIFIKKTKSVMVR